tara:strand:+ start:39728 stop:41614 length:1887 start_codon:yes stop_codon:yes gene_type:complete
MTENLQQYSLFIKNSKIFVGRILKRDSKTRNVELELNNQKNTICKIKDLILEVSLANSPVTANNIELSNLWSNLSNKAQIISINEFINFALNKYEINNYFDLCNLVEKLNIDYTFFKILNSESIYINSKEVVEKINLKKISKINNQNLNKEFIDKLKNKSKIDPIKYSLQYDTIKKFFEGKKHYDKKLINRIYEELNLNDNSFVCFLIDNNYFSMEQIIAMKFNLNNNFLYNFNLPEINKINLTEISAFTIDDENTKDYDDAISIKFHDDYVLISVHITNFSNLINYMSEPEIFARKNMQTIYSPYGNYNLYSDDIIEQISLIKNNVRDVISIVFKVDKEYKILGYELIKNRILIEENYSYTNVEPLINKNENFQFLKNFTDYQRSKRLINADFVEFNNDISLFLGTDQKLQIKVSNLESHKVISELMILANSCTADFMQLNNIYSIYRKQDESINLIVDSIESHNSFKFFRNVSPIKISTDNGPHCGLGVDNYIQFTSPIRRYHDSIIMRQLNSILDCGDVIFSKDDLENILKSTNSELEISKNKSKNVYKFCALKYLYDNCKYESDVYVYSILKNDYIIYLSELNIFDVVSKSQLKKTYKINEKISIKYDFIDLFGLNIRNIEEIL